MMTKYAIQCKILLKVMLNMNKIYQFKTKFSNISDHFHLYMFF